MVSIQSLVVLLAVSSCLSTTVQSKFCRCPRQPGHGRHSGQSGHLYRVGETITYSCDRGFRLTGLGEVICKYNRKYKSLTWTDSPRCIVYRDDDDDQESSHSEISHSRSESNSHSKSESSSHSMSVSGSIPHGCCPTLPALKNGFVKVDGTYQPGSIAHYACNNDYRLSNSGLRRCRQDFSWTGVASKCIPVVCPILPNPKNGHIRYTKGRHIGESIWYMCNPGFVLDGIESRTCLGSLTWSSIAPRCKCPIPCGKPEKPENGKVWFRSTAVGAMATYKCNVNYKLVGPSMRTCQGFRKWTPEVPTCVPVECLLLPNIVHGKVKYTEQGRQVGSSVWYICDDGYVLVGQESRTCLPNQTWTSTPPTCKRTSCDRPERPANGIVLYRSTSVGSEAAYKCRESHYLIGSSKRICQPNQKWAPEIPKCAPAECPRLSNPDNGYVKYSKKERSIGARVWYICQDGYTLTGSEARQCLADLTWSIHPPTCQCILCKLPEKPDNGMVSFTSRAVGAQATYRCGHNHRLVGSSVRRCQGNQTWTPEVPRCERVRCGRLLNPQNGFVVVDADKAIGSYAKYNCDEGFYLKGEKFHRCSFSGWTEKEPKCEAVKCEILPAPAHGSVGYSKGLYFNSTAEYCCDIGYAIKENSGDKKRLCQNYGVWTGKAPTCTRISTADRKCTTLKSPRHGLVSLTGRNVNDSASYSCNQGFMLSGPLNRTCYENGSWSDEEPKCIRRGTQCQDPPTPVYGFARAQCRKAGCRAKFSCRPGYKLHGATRAVCLKNGKWSIGCPVCKPTKW